MDAPSEARRGEARRTSELGAGEHSQIKFTQTVLRQRGVGFHYSVASVTYTLLCRLSDGVFTANHEAQLQARCLFANIARLFDFPIHQSMFILQSIEIRTMFKAKYTSFVQG